MSDAANKVAETNSDNFRAMSGDKPSAFLYLLINGIGLNIDSNIG